MLTLLAWLGRHATVVLFLSVFVGFAVPDLAALARPLLAPAVVLLLTATLLRLDWQAVGRELRQPRLHLLLFVWLQFAVPLIVFGIVRGLGLPATLEAALVLMAAAPPITSSAALAALLGLDGALALVTSLLVMLACPFVLPPLALELLGLELTVDLATFMGRLALLVGLALLLALVLRRWIGRERLHRLTEPLDGAFVLTMLVFAVGIMDGVAERSFERPDIALLWLAAACLANPLLQFLGMLVFLPLGRPRALTAGLVTGNRNMGLLLAALPSGVAFDVVLFFGIAQVPMYVLPALLRPLYRRLL